VIEYKLSFWFKKTPVCSRDFEAALPLLASRRKFRYHGHDT
jgi:hypothetical protein